jgi:hypothetical protein
MNRAAFDIDNKVLAGLIVGAITYALTKLSISLDPQVEQLVNVAAALLAAYLVPSKAPAELTAERAEQDDVTDPPTSAETAALRDHEVRAWDAAAHAPASVLVSANGGGTATLTAPAGEEVDEVALYGEVNRTGFTDADVAEELDSLPLDETDDDDGPLAGFR